MSGNEKGCTDLLSTIKVTDVLTLPVAHLIHPVSAGRTLSNWQ